jgi:hypothetical protein
MARSNTGSASNYFTTSSPLASGTNTLTIACWFRADSLTIDSNAIAISNAAGSLYASLLFDGNNSYGLGDNVIVYDNDGLSARTATTGTIGSTGTWNHIAGVSLRPRRA